MELHPDSALDYVVRVHTKFLQSCTHSMKGYAGLFQTIISMLILSTYLSKNFKVFTACMFAEIVIPSAFAVGYNVL